MNQKHVTKTEVIEIEDDDDEQAGAEILAHGHSGSANGSSPSKRKRASSPSEVPENDRVDMPSKKKVFPSPTKQKAPKQARQKATAAISSQAKKQIALSMIEEGRRNLKRDSLCHELDITASQLSDQLRDRASILQTLLAAVEKL